MNMNFESDRALSGPKEVAAEKMQLVEQSSRTFRNSRGRVEDWLLMHLQSTTSTNAALAETPCSETKRTLKLQLHIPGL